MDLEFIGRVLARLQPFVHERSIRRTRIERVMGTLKHAPDGVEAEVDRLLAMAGITIEEDIVDLPAKPTVERMATPASAPTIVATPDHENDIHGASGIASDLSIDVESADNAAEAARERIERDRYLRRPDKVLLTAEEEMGLGILIRGRAGTPLEQGGFARLIGERREAAVCLFTHNIRLVHTVAKGYSLPGMTHDDLVQHGLVGLIRAVELFDPGRGFKFSTYAMSWIRQAVTRGIANESRLIRLPVHMFERVNKVWATRARLTVDGRAPRLHQLATACELDQKQVLECLRLGPHDVTSLDTPVGTDGETTLADLLDLEAPDARTQIEFEEMCAQLRAALSTLTDRESGVISMRFGLDEGEPKTLDQIGQVYGVTRERIRQIEKEAMAKLRHPSVSQPLRDYLTYWT